MAYDTIVSGGNIHTGSESFAGDIGISGEQIAAVAGPGELRGGRRTRVIDARGKDVIPGVLDVHVHMALPFCGTVSCDDFEHGTRAALAGGVTTIIDFAIPGPGESLADANRRWHQKVDGRARVDYAWHMAITDRSHLAEIPAMIDQGMPTFKAFMIYEEEGWQADDATLYAALEQVRRHDGMLLVHAESSRVLDLLIDRARTPAKMKRYGARLHTMTRPNVIEAEAIQRAIRWCETTGGTLYIVHMSTGEGADLVRDAQARGVPVLAETCAQYLVLDDSVFGRKDGHLYACCPQVKKQKDIERLWAALETGDEVSVVSTDTCSFTRAQKAMWNGDFTRIPMGLPGLDTLLPIVYTRGVMDGRITINRLVEALCTNPARIMGLGDRKGHIAPGWDADLAIIDPRRTVDVDWRKLQSKADWSPYQGMTLGGFPRTTMVRGEVMYDRYRVVGEYGHGRFLERSAPGVL